MSDKINVNEKMFHVEMTILKIMEDAFPEFLRNFVFASGVITPADIVEQVVLECIKNAYEETSPKKSIRYFLQEDDLDSDDHKMRLLRIQKYVDAYRKREYDIRTKSEYRTDVDEKLSQLLPDDMSSMEGKLEGHKLTRMNFFELKTISELDLVKALTECRLVNTKKVNNDRFREIMDQYDKKIASFKEKWMQSKEDIVFYSLAGFTLEWKYAVDFVYQVATEMEKSGIKEIPDLRHRMVGFCGDIEGQSILGNLIFSHSRLLTIRQDVVAPIVNEEPGSELIEGLIREYVEALGIIGGLVQNATIGGTPIKQWFIDNTDVDDWASFFLDYDFFLFHDGSKKEWTNKRIRYAREIFSQIMLQDPVKR